ncbi:ATP synthase F0 subunit B [Candidatus Curtissbacteria bacterium RIFCSPLOWO2_01_FULL_42_26]|uniref:ATP synthase subunit b n=1 Tax=Candidatus Curtissbacteria bacterium RIFCSPLOWO2_01_FULL_42_26 TaxID=1797729 RepID=A0A1F5HYS4_9BACT|nr:MAG: ATP synthase F0 subunit B [Candidatus Curtissbacteria bacterium RIFCSPLOWO2_01_FULL_42_26]
MDILKSFGIQPTLLLAQIVNFLIILFLLSKFFYKPIIRMLEDRKKRIEQSLTNTDLIEEKLKNTQEKSTQIIKEAQKNAQDLITEAKNRAEQIIENANLEAGKSTEEGLKNAKGQIAAEKEQAVREVETHSLAIISAVIKKVMRRTISASEKNQLTKEAVLELTKQI